LEHGENAVFNYPRVICSVHSGIVLHFPIVGSVDNLCSVVFGGLFIGFERAEEWLILYGNIE
jgi:hypothetical protein